ncbi:MAG TPA: NAD(P)H-dependent oxidoreductase [Allosphingosinicella sp.]|jgi:chromate reductase
MFDIAVVPGSLRSDSISRRLTGALPTVAPPELRLRTVELAGIELYNEDLEARPPASWTHFRDSIRRADGILIVTPEYNRSVPGVLKNAVDVGSRPYGASVWAGKPAGIISLSPGGLGGFGANHHLRQSLVFLDCPVLQQPEAYLSQADSLVTGDGTIAERSREFLERFLGAYADWIGRLLPERAAQDRQAA